MWREAIWDKSAVSIRAECWRHRIERKWWKVIPKKGSINKVLGLVQEPMIETYDFPWGLGGLVWGVGVPRSCKVLGRSVGAFARDLFFPCMYTFPAKATPYSKVDKAMEAMGLSSTPDQAPISRASSDRPALLEPTTPIRTPYL